ncbi:MAG: redox-sensing transcriptional repressor Rex [Clostridia bacterium]|nr:redox-sensing transcriptional repressor Rex [Clostridia bacterium]
MQGTLSKATLGRLPLYLQFVRSVNAEKVSATQIAKCLGLGEMQVRKDLASVCAAGLPKVGYPVAALRRDMEKALGVDVPVPAVIVGVGKLGTALMEYDGFPDYGFRIVAAFDQNDVPFQQGRVPVYPMRQLSAFCASHKVRAGILTVPAAFAQSAADAMAAAGLKAILNFAPAAVKAPPDVTVHQENIALSLAYLRVTAGETLKQVEEEQYGDQSI